MKKHFVNVVILITGLLAFAGVQAEDKPMEPDAMYHGQPAMTGIGHGNDDANKKNSYTFGQPGNAKKVDRTIRIKALDTMRYDKRQVIVRTGETVRFIVTNAGKIRHEFAIGDAAEQHEHEKEMQGMPGMVMPDEANGISLAPGETKSIVWQFVEPGTIELACHEPGHYKAGMVSFIVIEKK